MKKMLPTLLLALLFLCTGCADQSDTPNIPQPCTKHTDRDDNGACDTCAASVLERVVLFSVNDLHGKVADGDTHPGVDELTTYLKQQKDHHAHTVLLSAGDMWQGSAESNLTQGKLTTEWMNELDFSAMTLGNHEFDWGEDPIQVNDALAEFPFLAINIYQRDTDTLADYCQPSVLVDLGDVQLGIIGAMGDCYSSISADKTRDIYFKTGQELTSLVKAESLHLRSQGADCIVYVLHDGYGQSKPASGAEVSGRDLASYYDTSLSMGYVDLVFEGHTHQRYLLEDEYGVYHLQNGGDNRGISRATALVNTANGKVEVVDPQLIATGQYAQMEDDPIVDRLLDQYAQEIEPGTQVLGTCAKQQSRDALRQLVADLYYQTGLKKWGADYDIVLGGGFISVRSPGYLSAGDVTYADLQGLFPFDNQLVLCSIQGRDLWSKFFATSNSNYFISYGDYGKQVRDSIDMDKTYYVVTDTYSSLYAPNNLTEVARYAEDVFARDLLADYVKAGGLK